MTEFQQNKKAFSWKKGLTAVILITVVITVLLFVFRDQTPDFESEIVQKTNVSEIISGTGSIVASQDANLSFEAAGLISQIIVSEGDRVSAGTILARLNLDELDGQISEGIYNLRREEARRDSVFGDSEDQNKLQNTKENLVSVLKKSYVIADDVVRNSIDPFFENPNVRYSNFDSALVDYFRRRNIEEQRYQISLILNDWQSDVETLDNNNVTVAEAQKYLNNLKPVENLLATISMGVGDFHPYSGKTQAQIDAYLNGISQARIRVASLLVEVNGALESLRQVQSESPVFDATIESLNASINRLQSRRNSHLVVAPFDGIIKNVFVNVGETVTPSTPVIAMISAGEKSVNFYVPEADIANLEVGDSAQITFNAFPDEYFEAVVGYVAPTAITRDGLNVFKTELYFVEPDSRIRVGMSAEVDIYTLEREDVLAIPGRAIIRSEGRTFVRVVSDKEISERTVTTGLRGFDGRVEITSGLNEGEELVTFLSN